MPGIERLTISHLEDEAGEIAALGIPAVLLFGIPADKDEAASGAYDDEGIVQLAVRALKQAQPDLIVITDVCLCEYMSHGHCGVVRDDGEVDNDVTLELLAKTAISHADAGADAVAPSDMMDGRVAAIRAQLDSEGHSEVPIVAYSAKFASAFYGPFREAADSAPAFGDRRGYQMDPANAREAVREASMDVEEGADVVMVKPALPYLDVMRRVREAVDVPVAAYNVSGEYAALKAAAERGWLDERAAVLESLTADPARRGRRDRDLPREGGGRVASGVTRAVPKLRSRAQGAAVPLDETDKRLLNALQSRFPLDPRPFEAVAREAGMDEAEAMERTARLLQRADHQGDHADLRHDRARLQLDAGRREGRLRASAPRRRGSSTSTPACRTTTCATTTSTCGSRSRPRPTRSSASTARSRC